MRVAHQFERLAERGIGIGLPRRVPLLVVIRCGLKIADDAPVRAGELADTDGDELRLPGDTDAFRERRRHL